MFYTTIILHKNHIERQPLQFLTTPEHCFKQIADFNYTANFLHVDDNEGGSLKLHYVDEGQKMAMLS